MKDTTDSPTIMDQIAEVWGDMDLGGRIAICWLVLVFIGLVTVGIVLPIAGLVMLGFVALFGTIFALVHLFEY